MLARFGGISFCQTRIVTQAGLGWGLRYQFPDDKALHTLPCFIRVAAERYRPVEQYVSGIDVDHLNLRVLNQGAYFLDAAMEEKRRTRESRNLYQPGGIRSAGRTGVLPTSKHNDPVLAAAREIAADFARKGLQACLKLRSSEPDAPAQEHNSASAAAGAQRVASVRACGATSRSSSNPT